MLNKISLYEKNINEINYNNKIFREQADKRFNQYQKEIETLRNNLNQEKMNKDKIIIEKIEESKKKERLNNEKKVENKKQKKEEDAEEEEEEEEEEEDDENEHEDIKMNININE